MSGEPDLRVAVSQAARQVAAAGLLVGTAGNVSARDGDQVAVTGSGVVLAGCTPDDVTVVALDGQVREGRLVPTSELALHLAIYAGGTAQAIVHTHAPWCTAVACVLSELPVLHYQQLALGGTIRVAPYATFGTSELATGVQQALRGRQAALLASHGAVAVGATLAAAVDNAVLLEWLAALHCRASALGPPRVLTEQQQTDVAAQALRRQYGTPRERTS